MDVLAEALAALVEAFVGMMIAAMELMAAVLALLCELLFVLVTQGYQAAHQRYGRRKAECRLAREAAREKQREDSAAATTPVSKTQAIVTLVVLLAMVSAGITFYVRNRIRQQKIQETRIQLASIANDVSQKVKDDVQPRPESGPLDERDAWNHAVELSLQEGVLGTRIVVRSDGPDEQRGTRDDICAFRSINHSVEEVTGKLAKRGIDKLTDKVAGLLPRETESENINEPRPRFHGRDPRRAPRRGDSN